MTATITREGEAGIQQHPAPILGVPKEIYENEARVAATPDTVKKLQKLGFGVLIQSGAGESANFTDEAYKKAGIQDVSCDLYQDARHELLNETNREEVTKKLVEWLEKRV